MILIITVAAYEDTEILVMYTHDIGEVVSGAIQSTSFSAQEKASFLKNHLFQAKITSFPHKSCQKKQKMLTFQNFWLDQHKWLVYSPSQQGGFCKYCVLFPPTTSQIKTSIPMKKFNKATGKSGYLAMHEQLEYHKDAVVRSMSLCSSCYSMSSESVGVQARIKVVCPLALYTHCRSHVLNLSIASAFKVPQISSTVDVINETFKFSPK